MTGHDVRREGICRARQRMLEHQIRQRGLEDPRILEAMGEVPREEFVPPEVRDSAYEDRALPIGFEQTISQPYTVAFMCQAAAPGAGDKVLEIGTGSGYGAAILSRLAGQVHTIERIASLAESARERLARLGYENVHVHFGDGTLGLPEEAPFDIIMVTAGARDLPSVYTEQLAEGGRIVIPLGHSPHAQHMWRFTLREGELSGEDLGMFAFVPLVGVCGWGLQQEESEDATWLVP